MTTTILVPLDGSKLAEAVLPLATETAVKTGGSIVLFSAVPPVATWDTASSMVRWDREEELAREYLNSQHELLAARKVEVRCEVRLGNAAEQILKAADDFSADLIAVSTHGRTGINRWVFGSVARQVLEASTVPILIVRPHKDKPVPQTVTKILVPLDASAVAESVLPEVETLATAFGASITLFNAIAPLASYPGFETVAPAASGDIMGQLQDEADAYLAGLVKRIGAMGIEVKAITTIDLAADGILLAAQKEAADLIAIGTHGRSGVQRAILGSVADSVIRRADVPCLVIRPKEA
jgi:nucleotide-binding universal stress UspA family protein